MNAVTHSGFENDPRQLQRSQQVRARSERIALVASCLALVKPAGMTDGDVRDWIAVATKALEHVPLDLLEMGCRAAQLRCTHHSQIVPVIEAETRDELAWRNRPKPQPVLMLALPAVPAEPIERPPLPEPDTLNPALQRMGLSRGWIIEAGDGRLVWSDVTTAGGEACNFGGSIRRTDPEP